MDPGDFERCTIHTIGYGDRPFGDLCERLAAHEIRFVIDVRSRPVSRQDSFCREALEVGLAARGLRYVWMGEELGGQPSDPSCYVDGHVSYPIVARRDFFRRGLERLVRAAEGGHRVALMCSELDPERCHRAKLIGVELSRLGIPVAHIQRDGTLASQAEVMDRVTGGQDFLFDAMAEDVAGRSRQRFEVGEHGPSRT